MLYDLTATPKLNAALVEAQKMLEPVKKESNNPFFKSKYADLGAVLEAIVPALNACGISLVQLADNDSTGVACITELRHVSGEMVRSRFWLPVVKADPQGYGSAFTYARRFCAKAIGGLAEEDDDGESHRDPKAKTVKDYTKPKTETKPVDTAAIVAAFEGYGQTPPMLEQHIGKPLAQATAEDVAKLKKRYAELKKLATADPAEEARRLEAAKAEAGIAAEQATARAAIDARMAELDAPKSKEQARNAAFKLATDAISEAQTKEVVALLVSQAAGVKEFGKGELAAINRAGENRILVLADKQRVIPARGADVPK